MPVEFLSDDQAAVYGVFSGPPSAAELDKFFLLDDADRELVRRRRGDANRLGFAVQLGTVRFLGTFLADPLAVPSSVPVYVARQLDIDDPSVVKAYGARVSTQWEHTAEIRTAYGYRDFAAGEARLREFLLARTWTRPERPTVVFDQAVAWLRSGRVLLPGVSVLARCVSQVRAESATRLYSTVADGVDPELDQRLVGLLTVPVGARVSELERLRKAPTRASGPEMVRALDRVSEIVGLGVAGVDTSQVPSGRLGLLARQGLSTDAAMLRRLPGARRTATMVAVVRALSVAAVDDALDLFAVLMATKLIGPAERASVQDRLRSLPRLTRASATLAATAQVLLDLVEEGDENDDEEPDHGQLWEKLNGLISRDGLAAAVAVIAELVPDSGDDVDRGRRVELVKRYATVRPFLTMLPLVLPLDCSDAGRAVLTAVRALGDLVGRKRVRPDEVAPSVVTGSWKALVYRTSDLPAGSVDHRAYTLCVLEALHAALRRREVFATGSARWGDPRARLLDGAEWDATRPQVLAALQLVAPAEHHLTDLACRLDEAYSGLARKLGPAQGRSKDSPLRLEPDRDGRVRLHLSPLEPIGESARLLVLRSTVANMVPQVDLPELLLEVHAWTGYLDAFTHVSEAGSRMSDLATSVAAVLIAQGCNLGFIPVMKPGHPALTRDRLSHVEQNYLRAETLAAANARLIHAQAGIGVAQLWGGGLVASVDGLRFVVPVRTLNAGPNPHYFGTERGVTWLNAINDQVSGIGAVVVTGTMRDSLHVLDVLLGRDGGPTPEIIATDTASYSDIVFGLFRLLGYQFSPRLADLPDQRLWRLTLPGAPAADYGPLNAVARHKINYQRIHTHWPDMLRIAGSLHTGTVAGYDLLRMLGRDGNPAPLGAALAEYGRAAKTLHLLAMCDPEDETYRRTVHTQLTVQESRHRLARKLFHGQRGELRQRYREGQEDQLGALGLVLNAVVLWNTRYIDAAITDLQRRGTAVEPADAARLSPLIDTHLNVHGRYAFPPLQSEATLRPLRDPVAVGL